MRSTRPLLGTYVTIEVRGANEAQASVAVNAAFAEIALVQRLMSAFELDSDVNNINHHAHLGPVQVHGWTAEVLRLAQELHHDSEGLFDCGVAPKLAAWGMLPPTTIDYQESSIANLRISDEDVVSCNKPTRIDLGGIAKGYAVDRATEAALKAGAVSVIVNAGGDLRVAGEIEEPIYIRDPATPGQFIFAGTLKDGAMASSATYFSREEKNGQMVSAIVNPISKNALISDNSYSVIAPKCVIADALTKVLALTGRHDMACFSRYDAHPLIV